ncbi:MAG TPA: hypothetical protein DCM38_06230 [Gammaproteobacteria bacterium]|nr:hypothetical protein [Gammaproteobacteria bacterium]
MIYERLKTSILLKPFLLISLALVVLGCSKDEEIRVEKMQPSESKMFSIDKRAPSCFTIDDNYLTSAYAEFEEIDTNNLFGVIISSGIKYQCRMRAQVQITATETATSGTHLVKIKFYYTYQDIVFDEFRYRDGTTVVDIEIVIP